MVKVNGPVMSFGGGHPVSKRRRVWPPYVPPPPPPDLIVHDSFTESANGEYVIAGTHNGQNYYRKSSGTEWFIWYYGEIEEYWVLSTVLFWFGLDDYLNNIDSVTGTYAIRSGGEPTAIVSLPP